MKKNIIIILFIMCWATFLYWEMSTEGLDLPATNCSTYQEFREQKIFGRVINKYVDKKNHSYKKVFFHNNASLDVSIIGYYPSIYLDIEIGDTIEKQYNSDTITLLKSNGINKKYSLSFNCKSVVSNLPKD